MNYESVINQLKNTLQQAGVLPEAENKATKSLMRQAVTLLDQAAEILISVAENHLKTSQAHNGDLNKALSDVVNFEAVAEMLDQYQLESDARDALESPKKSLLVPSGFTFTDTGLHGIAGKIVAYVREQAKGQALTAHVWPYRHDNSHMLSCDFHSKDSNLGFHAGNLDFSATSNGAGCHINDRLGDNDKNNVSDAEIGHITRNLFNVMQIRCSLALVTEFSGVPAENPNLIIPLCITAGQEQCSDPIDEPTVYDLPEALHLAGIIIRGVKADIEIGRYFNETNPAVLTRPLQHRQTNGPIYLWEENHA